MGKQEPCRVNVPTGIEGVQGSPGRSGSFAGEGNRKRLFCSTFLKTKQKHLSSVSQSYGVLGEKTTLRCGYLAILGDSALDMPIMLTLFMEDTLFSSL